LPREQPRHRIGIDVDEELYFKVINTFHWGQRNRLLREVLTQLMSAIDRAGMPLAYAIESGKVKLFEGREKYGQSTGPGPHHGS